MFLTIKRIFPAIARQRATTVKNLIALEHTKASEDLARIPIGVTKFREGMDVRQKINKQDHRDVSFWEERYRKK